MPVCRGLMATAASACSSNSGGASGNGSTSGGTLTIHGDTGNPTLVEDFNPFQPATELHGTYLIYAPLETVSTINGGEPAPSRRRGMPSSART